MLFQTYSISHSDTDHVSESNRQANHFHVASMPTCDLLCGF